MDQEVNNNNGFFVPKKERGQDNQQLQQVVGISEQFQDQERDVCINEKRMYHMLDALSSFSVKFAALQTLFAPN